MRPIKSTFALFAALLLALLTLALAPAREGAKLLINDLFSLSESANAYVYDRLPVAAGASRLPACALLGGALAFLSAAVALSQSRLPALLALVALALGQAYFGLSLPAAAQLLLLFALGLKLVPSRSAVQRLTLGAVVGSVLSIVGVVIVVSGGHVGGLLHGGANWGDGLMLLAMLAYAVYVILLKRWPMPGVPKVQLLYLQILAAVVVLLPLYLATPHVGLSMHNLPLVGFAGIGASMIAPLVWMHAVAHIGPSRASMFFNLVPLLTAVIAAVMLGESLAGYHAVGGVLTVAGVVLAELWKTPLGGWRTASA